MKIIKILIVFCLLYLLSGCAHSHLPGIWRDYPHADKQRLKIYLQYGYRNKLDTFERIYQKDLIENGTITVPFWLTTAEQDSIQAKMYAIKFFSLPDVFPPENITVNPSTEKRHLLIQYEDTKTYKLITWEYLIDTTYPGYSRFLELINLIVNIIESKPEYKALPASKGYYL